MTLGLRWCVLVVGVMFLFSGGLQAQPPKDGPPMPKTGKPGVSVNDAMGFKGYTLVAPMNSTKASLIDMEGRVVHTWECKDTPALSTYLLDNGNLLRPAAMGRGGPGAGGKVQEWSWDGQLLWDYKFEGKNQHPHHDITRLPNGNILMIVADHKTKDEAMAAGRRPETAQSGVTADSIIEVKPTGKNSGEVVWEWHAWDHLVQDNDKRKANFDEISAHPELIDINYGQSMFGKGGDKKVFKDKKDSKDTKVDLDKLKGLGDLGDPNAKGGGFNPSADWTHANAVAYNADLDQIVISIHSFSEIWLIDHSTRTKEAASHTGSKYGKGGDLLYRWGNPQAYRNGSNFDQRLFKQHNAHWIPKGIPGEGRGSPGGGKGGPGGGKGGPSGGPDPGGGSPGGLFRSYRYGIDHPAFRGRTLTPGTKIEEIQMAVRQGARTLVQSSSRPAD